MLLAKCRQNVTLLQRSPQVPIVNIGCMNNPIEHNKNLESALNRLTEAEKALSDVQNELRDLLHTQTLAPAPSTAEAPVAPETETPPLPSTETVKSSTSAVPQFVDNPYLTTPSPITQSPPLPQPTATATKYSGALETPNPAPQNWAGTTTPPPGSVANEPAFRDPHTQTSSQEINPYHATDPSNPRPVPHSAPTNPPKTESPWWTNEQTIIRLVGFFGATVTFIGIGFLVSIGIERGILGPVARIVLSAILGIVLLVAAFIMRNRQFHPAAVTAAVTTSLLVLGATDIALGFIMDLWPPMLASIGLAILLIGFGALARWWRTESQSIALGIAGFALLMWHFYYDFSPQIFPYSLAGLILFVIAYHYEWKSADTIAGVLTVVGALIGDTAASNNNDIGLFLALGMVVVVILKTHVSVPVCLALFTLSYDTPETYLLVLIVCVIWLALDNHTAPLIIMPIAFLPLALSLSGFDRCWVFVGFFLLFAAIMFYFRIRTQNEVVWIAWAVCAFMYSWELAVGVIFRENSSVGAIGTRLIAGAMIVMLIAAIFNRSTITELEKPLPLCISLVGLYFTMLVIVTLTTWITPTKGFLIGHAITSISWMILAAVLMIQRKAPLGVGITLAIAAIAKLVLFDMAALSGLPRSAAFLLSGILLIVIAALRGRTTPATTENSPAVTPVGTSL